MHTRTHMQTHTSTHEHKETWGHLKQETCCSVAGAPTKFRRTAFQLATTCVVLSLSLYAYFHNICQRELQCVRSHTCDTSPFWANQRKCFVCSDFEPRPVEDGERTTKGRIERTSEFGNITTKINEIHETSGPSATVTAGPRRTGVETSSPDRLPMSR